MPSRTREALTAAQAGALIAKNIDPVLVEFQRRFAPLCRSISMVPWDTDVYYFNTQNQLPQGGFVPDGGARQVSNSVYTQGGFQMKHLQSVGAITGYAQEVTRQVVGDLRNREVRSSIQGYFWDVETALCWGNAASTFNNAVGPQFDGLDTQISNFSATQNAAQNALDKAGATLTLATLDEVADMVQTNAAADVFNSGWQYVMSNTAISKIAQLLTNQQRFEQVEVAPGLLVSSYRNIPMVPTSFMSSRGTVMATVTPSTATTGGSLPATTTYRYVVTAIMSRVGETLPCVEVSQTTGSGSTNLNILSFTPPGGFEGATPISYKVYRTAANGAAGSETLLGYVDAAVGLNQDGVTPIIANQITDTGTALIAQYYPGSGMAIMPGLLPQQYFGTNAGAFPPAPSLENIYLISRDKNDVCRPYVREAKPLDVYPTTAAPDSLPYALIGDMTFAIRLPKVTGRAARVSVSL